MSINKDKYRGLCSIEPSIPIFSKDWWLDAVCGTDDWDVVLVEKGGQVIASLPFFTKKKMGFNIIEMPNLTQTMGPWIKYPPEQKYATKLSYEKKVITSLINQLPIFDFFRQSFHHSITNWLPFYWQGFQQTTRYTYVIEDLSDSNALFRGFRENIRREIRKAQKRVIISTKNDIEKFYQMNSLTFNRKAMNAPYSLDFLKKLDTVCEKRGCRKIFFGIDEMGQTHSAIYVVWDDEVMYYLMGGIDPDLRNSGANSLVMWEAIKFASKHKKRFDFEGSMIEPVERFCRAFGATQKPYFSISKTNSNLAKLWFFIKDFR